MSNFLRNPVLGAIAGDMIGVPYEFLRRGASIKKDFPLWSNDSHFSDDSVMTLAVAKWLLTSPLNTNDLVKIMQELGDLYPNVGYGGSFSRWLQMENPTPYGSWGNGSAMRVSPVGCCFKHMETVKIVAGMSASVSHNHPEGVRGAQVIATLILHHLRYGDKYKGSYWDKEVIKDFAPEYNIERSPKEIRDSGYTFEVSCQRSVPEAICCFMYSNSYEETIREAILLGGDTDTQAAMAGSIAAACWGIPRDIADEALGRLPSDLLYILEDFSKMYKLVL